MKRIILLVALLLLTGCGDPSKLSDSDKQTALIKYYEKTDDLQAAIDKVDTYYPSEKDSFKRAAVDGILSQYDPDTQDPSDFEPVDLSEFEYDKMMEDLN